jgi:hypothetical protein
LNGAAVKLHLAKLAALGTGQLGGNVGHGLPNHPLLNAAAQRTTHGMRGGFDLTEMNGAARPPFGGLKVRRRLRRLTHQSVQFFLQCFDFSVHDAVSELNNPGERFPARLHASHFNRCKAISPIDVLQTKKFPQMLTCTPTPHVQQCHLFSILESW